jgi:hypothetical protein
MRLKPRASQIERRANPGGSWSLVRRASLVGPIAGVGGSSFCLLGSEKRRSCVDWFKRVAIRVSRWTFLICK